MGVAQQYGLVLGYLSLSLVLALILFALSYLLILKQTDIEKVSAYECGFDPSLM